MITAETLKTLTTFTAPALTRAIQSAGYKTDSFKTAKFVGITNSGQFCYQVTYGNQVGKGRSETGKVFLTYDGDAGKLIAGY